MSSAASSVTAQQDAFWWQGSLMQIKARAEDTGGALGIVDGTFYQGFGPPLHVHSREDEALYVLEGQIRIRQGTTSSSPAPARVSGGHGECRTPSRWSPKARVHLSSSRPEASSGCSRRAACRPASQPTHPARSTSRRRRSRWRRGLGSRSSDRSSHSSAWLLGLWRSTWRSPSWRSLSAGSRLRGAAGRAGSGR
jgi:hypothetical protein